MIRIGSLGLALVLSMAACTSGSSRPTKDDERFSVCPRPEGVVWGSGAPGSPCEDASDCTTVCCTCPRGPTQYSYASCQQNRCASVCDPVNDTRAPVCDGAVGGITGCMQCAQILSEALSDGDDLGSMACAGNAASAWTDLTACVAGSCNATCAKIEPSSPCVDCISGHGSGPGCASEVAACLTQ